MLRQHSFALMHGKGFAAWLEIMERKRKEGENEKKNNLPSVVWFLEKRVMKVTKQGIMHSTFSSFLTLSFIIISVSLLFLSLKTKQNQLVTPHTRYVVEIR